MARVPTGAVERAEVDCKPSAGRLYQATNAGLPTGLRNRDVGGVSWSAT